VSDKDENNICSSYDIFCIKSKAKYLALTLTLALTHYPTTHDFLDICKLAIDKIDDIDHSGDVVGEKRQSNLQIKSPRTIMQWLRDFRRDSYFPNPASNRVQYWNNKIPAIFSNNPDLHKSFVQHAKCNLSTLSGHMMLDFLLSKALPAVVANIQKSRDECGILGRRYTVKQFLLDNNLPKLSLATIYNWLQRLGFTYDLSKKTYYVDSHEKEENVKYRSAFIQRYLEHELLTHRWIQIPLERYEEMIQKHELHDGMGHKFQKNDSTYHVELHVDDHPTFQDECNSLPYGGNLSVRKDPNVKPLLIMGQDESIFKQYSLSKKSWSDPDGTRALLPKEDGQGVMISSFVSREFGYGLNLTADQLDQVNTERRRTNRKFYKDDAAAIMKNGTTKKPILTHSPFTRLLEYGKNNEGYWTYESMVIQLEDCVDSLQTLFPEFDVLILFDHSNGHDRLQPDGLNLRKIRKNFGGKQPKMHDSVLTLDCFGKYHNENSPLQEGSIQSMCFLPTDSGPFYLTPAENISRRVDQRRHGTRTRALKREKLVEMLKEMGIVNPIGNVKQLQAQCKGLDLPTTSTEDNIIEGWVGKPKGSLQILYERGWIDPNDWKQYTNKGKMSDMGILMKDTSLNLILQQQPDFLNELTLLQHHGKQMGVKIERSPKCHPELAGEGIEYAWGFAKVYYRYQPLYRKSNKQKFRQLVDECLSSTHLTLSRIRKCSRRAREYMLVYRAVERVTQDRINESDNGDQTNPSIKQQLNYELIEKSIKTYKSHRNAIDFDKKFIKALGMTHEKETFLKEIVTKMKTSS
jgi:hypothetical protein